ncbi:MAG TPA: hypothetical protein VK188_14355 [Holophaga sp.]|nr:hypothetical protein [Holophaga sp.]
MRLLPLLLACLATASALRATPPASPRSGASPASPLLFDGGSTWVLEDRAWCLKVEDADYTLDLPDGIRLEGRDGAELKPEKIPHGSAAYEALKDARLHASLSAELARENPAMNAGQGLPGGIQRFLQDTAWVEEPRHIQEAPPPPLAPSIPDQPVAPDASSRAKAPVLAADPSSPSLPDSPDLATSASAFAAPCFLEARGASLVATEGYFTVHLPGERMLYGGSLYLGHEWSLHPETWREVLSGQKADLKAIAALRLAAVRWMDLNAGQLEIGRQIEAFLAHAKWLEEEGSRNPALSPIGICLPCGVVLTVIQHMEAHNQIHQRTEAHTCKHADCKASYPEREALDLHLKMHRTGCMWSCDACLDQGLDADLLASRARTLAEAKAKHDLPTILSLLNSRYLLQSEAKAGDAKAVRKAAVTVGRVDPRAPEKGSTARPAAPPP